MIDIRTMETTPETQIQFDTMGDSNAYLLQLTDDGTICIVSEDTEMVINSDSLDHLIRALEYAKEISWGGE